MMEKQSKTINENFNRILKEIQDAAAQAGRDPADVQLMAVTKTQTAEKVNAAIAAGARLLGENRAQELNTRYEQYNRDGVEIHFIGQLQTNKVRQIVDKVTMIQVLDRMRLAKEIERQCEKLNKVMQVLVEVNIGGEESKFGIPPEDVEKFVREVATMPHLQVRGLMAIPPICDTKQEIESYFSQMQKLKVDIESKKIDNVAMDVLSMGMSGDYLSAVKYGATIVRIGTAIFGERA